jgi:hypothetical protein
MVTVLLRVTKENQRGDPLASNYDGTGSGNGGVGLSLVEDLVPTIRRMMVKKSEKKL